MKLQQHKTLTVTLKHLQKVEKYLRTFLICPVMGGVVTFLVCLVSFKNSKHLCHSTRDESVETITLKCCDQTITCVMVTI